MAVDNIIEELEREGNKNVKAKGKVKSKKTKSEALAKPKSSSSKNDSSLFSLAIVVVVILGIIGIVFGYTKDKLSEIKKGGSDATAGLEEQVKNLNNKLDALQQKASSLEQESSINKAAVIDLFDKGRTLPNKVITTDWNVLRDAGLSFAVSFPKTWESVKAVIQGEQKPGDKTQELVYLQPIGQADFLNAITIKKDYPDFADLKMDDKEDIFKELSALDRKDFDGMKFIYFINLDKDNKEVPTILILADKAIYRATFNVADKKVTNYFQYRKDFEEIMTTFTLTPVAEVKPAEPAKPVKK